MLWNFKCSFLFVNRWNYFHTSLFLRIHLLTKTSSIEAERDPKSKEVHAICQYIAAANIVKLILATSLDLRYFSSNVTGVGKKNFELPGGIVPHTLAFRAPMRYHLAATTIQTL